MRWKINEGLGFLNLFRAEEGQLFNHYGTSIFTFLEPIGFGGPLFRPHPQMQKLIYPLQSVGAG